MARSSGAVTVLLFASARELVGRGSIRVPVPAEGLAARALVRALEKEFPAIGRTLRTSRFVRNGRYLEDLAERLRPGDEFAVHPPYGGG